MQDSLRLAEGRWTGTAGPPHGVRGEGNRGRRQFQPDIHDRQGGGSGARGMERQRVTCHANMCDVAGHRCDVARRTCVARHTELGWPGVARQDGRREVRGSESKCGRRMNFDDAIGGWGWSGRVWHRSSEGHRAWCCRPPASQRRATGVGSAIRMKEWVRRLIEGVNRRQGPHKQSSRLLWFLWDYRTWSWGV